MKCKKTALPLLILLIISILIIITGCGDKNKTKKESKDLTVSEVNSKISKKIDAYLTDLSDSKNSMKNNDAIEKYLVNWAKSKDISNSTDKNGNVIFEIKSSKKYKNSPPTVIICPYDHLEYENYKYPIALSLYTAKNSENTGKLTIIFTKEVGHDFSGVKSLHSKFFTDDTKVICLNAANKGLISNNSGGSCQYKFVQNVKRVTPTLNKAFKISISGLPISQPDSKIREATNPINKLEGLLVSLKNRNTDFEIASFNGGIHGNLYAPSASITLLIDPNKEESFLTNLNETIEKFNNDKHKYHPGAVYSCKVVERPATVIDRDSSNKLVNFMYTMINGIYESSDDGIPKSIVNMSQIDVGIEKAEISSVAYSLEDGNLKSIDSDLNTLCNLSGIIFTKTATVPKWNGNAKSKISSEISEAYKKATGKPITITDSITSTSASYISKKNSKCEIIAITLNENIVKDCTSTIIHYLIDNTSDNNDK